MAFLLLGSRTLFFIGFLCTITCFVALAADINPLDDFCVAEENSPGLLAGGAVCKDPKIVNENDFFGTGVQIAGDTSNALGSNISRITFASIPGLNTLGLALSRIDYAPLGINTPHTHPRATELYIVIEGTIRVGFVTSSPDNRHITKVLNKGDLFVFPQGLVHYNQNIGKGNAVAIAALNSQNPGTINIASAVFGAKPHISADILAKAFQVNESIVHQLQAQF